MEILGMALNGYRELFVIGGYESPKYDTWPTHVTPIIAEKSKAG